MDAARALASRPTDPDSCTATVSRWFDSRGVRCIASASASPITVKPSPRVADDIKWLSWVRKSVQPRAREMVARYGWRYVAEACAGRITTYEEWETLMRDIEYELEVLPE